MPEPSLAASQTPFPEFDETAPQTRQVRLPDGSLLEIPLNPTPDLLEVLGNLGVDLGAGPDSTPQNPGSGDNAPIAGQADAANAPLPGLLSGQSPADFNPNAAAVLPEAPSSPTPDPAPAMPAFTPVVVGPRDRALLPMTRAFYGGDNQFAGLAAAYLENNLPLSANGSPVIARAQPLRFPDLSQKSAQTIASLDRLGRSLVANNSTASAPASLVPDGLDWAYNAPKPAFPLNPSLGPGNPGYIQSRLNAAPSSAELVAAPSPFLEPFYRRAGQATATMAASREMLKEGQLFPGLLTGFRGVSQGSNIALDGLLDNTFGRLGGAVTGADYAAKTDELTGLAATGATFLAPAFGATADFALVPEAAELAPYREGGGHHVLAKRAFEGAPEYNPRSALAIPNRELDRLNIRHFDITGDQKSLYNAFAKTSAPLTWEAMHEIEMEALVRNGMDPGMASTTLDKAIQAMKDSGISGPVRIPWGGQ